MKIGSVGAELFHADGQTDKHGEADRRFSQFYESAKKETACVSSCLRVRDKELDSCR